MKWIVSAVILCFAFASFSQRDLNPRNSKKMFGGAQSFQDYNLYGLQFQLGGTFLMNRLQKNNERYAFDPAQSGFRGNFLHDPIGKVGFYGEVGMFHFPKKFPKLKISKKKSIVLLSYYDWGLGFKYFRGAEDITVNYQDAVGNEIGTEEGRYNFSHGSVYGRFSLHKNVYFKPKNRKEKLNFFLDHSLGLNFDYRLITNSDDYTWPTTSVVTSQEQYYKPFQAQLHYGLGFGFSPRRGMFIIPGVRLPILGYHTATTGMDGSGNKENYFGKPSMHWFSSRYWPILFNVKFMFAFPKKPKGCATGITNDQDKETQQGR